MRRWAVGLVAVLAVGPVAAQETPQDVVKKAISAHGGLDTLKKYPAAKSEAAGRMVVGTAEVPITLSVAIFNPSRSRVEMTLGPAGGQTTGVQIVNGEAVKQTHNGVAVEMLDDVILGHARQSVRWNEVQQLHPLLDAARFTLTAEKDAPFGGKKFAVVVVKADGMPDTTLYFDRTTGLLTRTKRTSRNAAGEEVVEVTVRSAFKKFQGLTLPTSLYVTHNGKPYLATTLTKFTPAETLDDALFDTK